MLASIQSLITTENNIYLIVNYKVNKVIIWQKDDIFIICEIKGIREDDFWEIILFYMIF